MRVRGLPPTVSLSEGYATAPGAWSVPLYALASLQMIVPAGVAGRAELSISLVSEDGALLAEAKVRAGRPAAPRATAARGQSPSPAAEPAVSAPPTRRTAAGPPRRPPRAPHAVAGRSRGGRTPDRTRRARDRAGQRRRARGQFFLRAAQAGLARGALLLAATYDPRELARWGVQGVQPNLTEARKWYERARELGAPEAEERLARLGSG